MKLERWEGVGERGVGTWAGPHQAAPLGQALGFALPELPQAYISHSHVRWVVIRQYDLSQDV